MLRTQLECLCSKTLLPGPAAPVDAEECRELGRFLSDLQARPGTSGGAFFLANVHTYFITCHHVP